MVSTPGEPVFSIDVSTHIWDGFLSEVSRDWPIERFRRPDGLVEVAIDPFTGLLPARGADTIDEWFIEGTQPDRRLEADTCGIDVLRFIDLETRHGDWMRYNSGWIRRADVCD